jgi:hypothetical protein
VHQAVHLLEKSVINMIWLLVPGFDWPVIMIGPSGLLLVVPTYLQLLFQFYGFRVQKLNNLTWMWEIHLQGLKGMLLCVENNTFNP